MHLPLDISVVPYPSLVFIAATNKGMYIFLTKDIVCVWGIDANTWNSGSYRPDFWRKGEFSRVK